MSTPSRTLLAFAITVMILLAAPCAFAQQDEITVKEWDVPTPGSAPHDIVVDGDGIVWYTAIGANKIGRFDPATEQFSEFDIPTQSSRPHGLVADRNGNIWFTEQGASKIGRLDIETGEIEEFATPTPGSGAHTPILGDGVLWFTEQSASKIARLDIGTGEIDEFPTPTPNSSPYGIILDEDGNPWYAALSAHRIAKVDAETGEITEYPTPTAGSGTRRIAIDSTGKLWFTEYNAGKVGSYDPATGEFKEYDTSSRSSGPYAIWVDIHDNVWFSMADSHKTGRFDQETGTLHEYDMPTPNTTSRFIYADGEGKVRFPNDVNDKIGVITLASTASGPEPTKAIVITEVELSSVNGTQWIEVYNPADREISLATMYVNASDGSAFQIVGGAGSLPPQQYQLVTLEPSGGPWSDTDNAIAIYETDPGMASATDSAALWDRTPSLTDTFADSRTWQLNGTEWELSEATPSRAIPEFGPMTLIVIAAGIVGAVLAASRLATSRL